MTATPVLGIVLQEIFSVFVRCASIDKGPESQCYGWQCQSCVISQDTHRHGGKPGTLKNHPVLQLIAKNVRHNSINTRFYTRCFDIT